jgi:hypothetical protein
MKFEDRPLMDAAARVLGIPLRWPEGETDLSPRRTDSWVVWNPIDDGTDAMDVAVALNMRIEPARPARGEIDRVSVSVAGKGHVGATVIYGDDRAAAWRRAIVETAAALANDVAVPITQFQQLQLATNSPSTRPLHKMTPQQLFDYASTFSEKGSGGQYPTVREASQHFGVSQLAVIRACEEWEGDGYMKPATGFKAGSGVSGYDRQGDYLVEAYK